MAATILGFFSPTDILSLGGNFIVQSCTPSDTLQRAQGLLGNGDEGITKTYGGKTDLTVVYEYQSEAGNITLPKVGEVKATYHVDRVRLEYRANAWPLITITCHKHAAATHTAANQFAASVTFPAQFGIPRSLTDTTSPTPVDLWKMGADDAGIGVKSMSYECSCTHLDEDGETSAHLAGQNRDGVEKLDVGLTGIPASITVLAGWANLSNGTSKGNTAADTQTMSYERHALRVAV